MSSSNPISPKAVWAGVGPALLAFLTLIVALLTDGAILEAIPEPWRTVALITGSGLTAAIAAYRARDGLRLPTLDQDEVDKLNDGPTVP